VSIGIDLAAAGILGSIPPALRNGLLSAYADILKNFREKRWESSELNGGKLCEVVHTILRGYVDGRYPARAKKPQNMIDACRSLEAAPADQFPRSVRIQIPRMLIALYEIRNNRGVGHTGGEVDPNHMDATCVLYMSKWILAELVRVFHQLDPSTASRLVDAITDRVLPVVWEVDGNLRVLDTRLSMMNKALILLYHRSAAVREADLCSWVEHSNPSTFRRDVLRRAHKEKLIEYDQITGFVQLSPKGIAYVDDVVLGKLSGDSAS
jgi:hypothetical protein